MNPPPQQKYLSTEFWCPVSGFSGGGETIEPHKVPVIECANGSLYAWCPRHMAKVFVQDVTTIRFVTKHSTVLRVKAKRPKKEDLNAAP